jgi:PAS domain S-box-containing protein
MRKIPSYEELQQKVNALEKQIIEIKASEAALRSNEQNYRDLYENAPIAYFSIKRNDGTISKFNSEAVRLLGYKKETLAQMNVLDLYADTAHGVSRAKALFESFQTGESVRDEEMQMKRHDGRLIWVSLNIEPVKSSGGDVVESRSMVIDISKRKQVEDALSESEAKVRALAESAPAVIIIATDEDLIYVNPAFESITGFTEKEAMAMSFWDLVHPDMQELVKKRGLARQRGEAVPAHYELKAVTKDGHKRWFDVAAASINYGGQTATLAMAYDITDRKRAEEALREKDNKLELQAKNLIEINTALKVLLEQREKEKTEMKETLLANVKKLIFPYIEKLENSGLNEDAQTFVNIIKSNINDLISPLASNLSSKYFALTPTEIQIADLIKQGKTSKEIASMLNVSPKAVSFHRGNLRKKLGLLNKKINLGTYLQSFPH